jgi:hypothetical protein
MTFEEFVLESTGRDMDYHKNAGTVGMEFAQQAFDAGANQAPMKPCDGLTPDALRKWGEALNDETPQGLGAALIQFADALVSEQQELAAAFTEVAALKYSLQLDEDLIGKIQQVISVLASRPVVTPNATQPTENRKEK